MVGPGPAEEEALLCLERRIGEVIYIGEDPATQVEIKVLDLGGGRVRLGIRAPRGLSVYREEVWRKILKRREESAKGNGTEQSEQGGAGRGPG